LPDRRVVLVFGITGKGKTTWTRRMLAAQHRAVIMDPQGEYREFTRYDDIDQCLLAMDRPVFRVTHPDPANFKWLCLGARAAGRCWLVIEEAHFIMPSHEMPPQEFKDVIYRGRHQEVSVLLVAQRPTTVHISARSQWSDLITFQQTERADVQWLESVTGQSLPVQELERGEYLHIAAGEVKRKVLTLPPLRATIPAVDADKGSQHSGGDHVSGMRARDDDKAATREERLSQGRRSILLSTTTGRRKADM
jgi:hypothetical protein